MHHVNRVTICRYIINGKALGSGSSGTCHRGLCLRMIPVNGVPLLFDDAVCFRDGSICLRQASQAYYWYWPLQSVVFNQELWIHNIKKIQSDTNVLSQEFSRLRESWRCWKRCSKVRSHHIFVKQKMKLCHSCCFRRSSEEQHCIAAWLSEKGWPYFSHLRVCGRPRLFQKSAAFYCSESGTLYERAVCSASTCA